MTFFPLEAIGSRICIIGCSSSGKSTLADALSKKLNIPVTHLDFLAHHENSNWKRKSDDDLIASQQQIIAKDAWIIEGNYSVCMQERFQRATTIIWIDLPVMIAAFRYIKRCLFSKPNRIGKLPGSQREFDFGLLRHILKNYPKNRRKYQTIIQTASIPTIKIDSVRELKAIYECWRLIKG